MGESDSNSSSTESNDPHTPLHTAPYRPTNTTRTLTAPSKLPKPRPISARFPISPSHPQTQSSPVVPTTPLDWGEDWSRLSEEIKKRSPAVDMSSRPTAEQDSLFDESESDADDEVLPKVAPIPVDEATRALQSAISFEATFDGVCEGASGDAEQSPASSSATSDGQEQKTVATPQPSTPEHVVGSVSNRRSKDAERGDHLVELAEAVSDVHYSRWGQYSNAHLLSLAIRSRVASEHRNRQRTLQSHPHTPNTLPLLPSDHRLAPLEVPSKRRTQTVHPHRSDSAD
jgi:hypothetical protein